MSAPSTWPLPEEGVRFLTPEFMIQKLAEHPLTEGCYPTAMGYYPNAQAHRMERQRPDDNLILYCTEGCGQLRVGDWQGKIVPGQVMLLPQGLRHLYEADSHTPWTLFWVHFRGTAADHFLQYLGFRERHPVLKVGVSPALKAGFYNLMEVRRTGYSTRAFIRSANQLRHLLSQIAVEKRTQRDRGRSGLELAPVQAFMQENIYQSLTLEQLAASANMSKYHFSMRYKELSGYSPIRHFLNMKMEHACDLLDSTSLGVSAIALRMGYEDPLYFSRVFRRTIGRSPRAYRASIRRD